MREPNEDRTAEFRLVIAQNRISTVYLASLFKRSLSTIYSWRSGRHYPIPDSALRALKLHIELQKHKTEA